MRGAPNVVRHHIWVVGHWEALRHHTGAVEEDGVEGGRGAQEGSDLEVPPPFLQHLVPMRAKEPSILLHLVQPVGVYTHGEWAGGKTREGEKMK